MDYVLFYAIIILVSQSATNLENYMKKWLITLSIIAMSSNAYAYRGATTDFTKELFHVTYSGSMAKHIHDDDQHACMIKKAKATIPTLATRYVNETLSNKEIKQLDKFFDMPYGQAVLQKIQELNAGSSESLNDAFDEIDDLYEHRAEYQSHLPVLEKLFNDDNLTSFVDSEEFVGLIMDTLFDCDLLDQ